MTDYKNHIEANPKIMFGKPCIKGTRIPIDLILEKLAWGETIEDLLDAYPRVKENDILACIEYGKKEHNLKGFFLNIIN